MNARITRAVVVLSAAVLAAACGKKSETVTVKTGSGDIAVTANASGMALPAEFPKDVPVMKGAAVNAVMGSAEQGNQIVYFAAPSPVNEVTAYYQQELKTQGWTAASATANPDGGIYFFKKDGRDLMLTIAKDGKVTNIQVALPHHKG